jgi:peptidoglycan/LPS O-acetylase OafA/YrhL
MRPARRLGYVPALDGVRGIAITLVVLWHAFHQPVGGFLGVHVFFVLSGFLITTLLLQEWGGKGSISLRHFYFRRGLRLLPALAAMLLAYTAIQTARALVLEPGELDLSTALKGVGYSAFYISNIVQASGVVLGVTISQLWSLATEEQFYLLWPFVLVLALRAGAGRRAIAIVLGAAIALVAANRLYLTLADAPRVRLYFAPDTTFDAILVGCLLGLWFASGRFPRGLRSRRFALWATPPAFAYGAVIVATTGIESRALYAVLLLPFVAASAVLVLAVLTEGSLVARILAVRPFVFLGRISYSLYLWHTMALVFGRDLLGLPSLGGVALGLVAATISYYAIEQPFLRLKARDRAAVEREDSGRDGRVSASAGTIIDRRVRDPGTPRQRADRLRQARPGRPPPPSGS